MQYRGYGSILPSGNAITMPNINVATAATAAVSSVNTTALSYEPYSGSPLLFDLSTCLGLSEELCIGRNVPKVYGDKKPLEKSYGLVVC
jgi:hypothetical protein